MPAKQSFQPLLIFVATNVEITNKRSFPPFTYTDETVADAPSCVAKLERIPSPEKRRVYTIHISKWSFDERKKAVQSIWNKIAAALFGGFVWFLVAGRRSLHLLRYLVVVNCKHLSWLMAVNFSVGSSLWFFGVCFCFTRVENLIDIVFARERKREKLLKGFLSATVADGIEWDPADPSPPRFSHSHSSKHSLWIAA